MKPPASNMADYLFDNMNGNVLWHVLLVVFTIILLIFVIQKIMAKNDIFKYKKFTLFISGIIALYSIITLICIFFYYHYHQIDNILFSHIIVTYIFSLMISLWNVLTEYNIENTTKTL